MPHRFFDPRLLARIGRLSLVARTVVEGVIAGLHRSPYRGFSMEFTSHRHYVPGDEIRRVDWKAYGRLDRFFVKEYEEETNLRAYLMVDCSASMGYGRAVTKLGFASLLACSLAYLFIRQRDAVGLVTYGERTRSILPPRSAFNHLDVIAAELEGSAAEAGTDTGNAIETLAATLKRRGLIILISDFLDPAESLALSLKHLRHRKNDVIVFQVLDADELDLPFDKTALFLDMESDLKVTANPADVRAAYRSVLGDHLSRIRSACHENGVDYELFSTAEPLSRSLIRFLSRREERR